MSEIAALRKRLQAEDARQDARLRTLMARARKRQPVSLLPTLTGIPYAAPPLRPNDYGAPLWASCGEDFDENPRRNTKARLASPAAQLEFVPNFLSAAKVA